MSNFHHSKNKFKYVYLLNPKGISEKIDMTSRFLKRWLDEYDALKREIETIKNESEQMKGIGQKIFTPVIVCSGSSTISCLFLRTDFAFLT